MIPETVTGVRIPNRTDGTGGTGRHGGTLPACPGRLQVAVAGPGKARGRRLAEGLPGAPGRAGRRGGERRGAGERARTRTDTRALGRPPNTPRYATCVFPTLRNKH